MDAIASAAGTTRASSVSSALSIARVTRSSWKSDGHAAGRSGDVGTSSVRRGGSPSGEASQLAAAAVKSASAPARAPPLAPWLEAPAVKAPPVSMVTMGALVSSPPGESHSATAANHACASAKAAASAIRSGNPPRSRVTETSSSGAPVDVMTRYESAAHGKPPAPLNDVRVKEVRYSMIRSPARASPFAASAPSTVTYNFQCAFRRGHSPPACPHAGAARIDRDR